MTEPIIRAVRDQDSFALVEVSRIDWVKFGAKSPAAVAAEYKKHDDPRYVRLHLDHVPVIDEDQKKVDYRAIIEEAIALGYQSVMIDASRLSLDENIRVTRGDRRPGAKHRESRWRRSWAPFSATRMGRCRRTRSCSRPAAGFTRTEEAARFAKESGCDWLSVAIGNIHGAVGEATKDAEEGGGAACPGSPVEARRGDRAPAGAARRIGHQAGGHAGLDEAGHREGERRHRDPPGLRAGVEGRRQREGGAGCRVCPDRRP